MSHLTNWSQLPKLPNFCFCTNTSSPVCSTARRPLLEGVWRPATVSLIQIQSTHSWNSTLTKLGRWTPRRSLYVTSSTGSHSPPSCPANVFFVLPKLMGNYSHSSMLLLQCKLCLPEGQVYTVQWNREIPIQRQGGPADKLKSYPKPEVPNTLCLCSPGLPSFPGWASLVCKVCHSEETTLDVTSICHTDKTQASPVCSGCNSPSRGLHPSIRTWITGGLKKHKVFWGCRGSHKEDSGWKQAGGCQSNSSACNLSNSSACNLPPAPQPRSPREEQSREWAVSW